jgi:hypothetical protein
VHVEHLFNRKTGQAFKIYSAETYPLGWSAESGRPHVPDVALLSECDAEWTAV